jgi:hypothetical protein
MFGSPALAFFAIAAKPTWIDPDTPLFRGCPMAQILYVLAAMRAPYPQRAAAAFLAIDLRLLGVNFAARAFAPAFPLRTLPDFTCTVSTISPVAIRMTWTALPITSAGRFSPLGPLGIVKLYL